MQPVTKFGNDRRLAGGALATLAMFCVALAPLQAVPIAPVNIADPQREVSKDPYGLTMHDLAAPSMSPASTPGTPVVTAGGGGGGGGAPPAFGFGGGSGGGLNNSTVGSNNNAGSSYLLTDPTGVSLARDALARAAAAAAESVPEGGATIIMLGCGLVALFFFRRHIGRLLAR